MTLWCKGCVASLYILWVFKLWLYLKVRVKFKTHIKLRKITLMATNVHVILKSYVVLTWMWDIKRINVACGTME